MTSVYCKQSGHRWATLLTFSCCFVPSSSTCVDSKMAEMSVVSACLVLTASLEVCDGFFLHMGVTTMKPCMAHQKFSASQVVLTELLSRFSRLGLLGHT